MAEIWGKLLYIHNPAELSMITKSGSACFRSLGRSSVKCFFLSRNYHTIAVELHFTAKPEEQPYASIT
jgi:hypothetical protein